MREALREALRKLNEPTWRGDNAWRKLRSYLIDDLSDLPWKIKQALKRN